MGVEKINKIIKMLLEAVCFTNTSVPEACLFGEDLELYRKQKGAIATALGELLPIYKKLNNLEWNNQHSEYMLEVARFCNDDKYIKIFEHILDLHELDRSLNYRLSQYRDFQWEGLKKKYEEKLQPLGISPTDIENELPF